MQQLLQLSRRLPRADQRRPLSRGDLDLCPAVDAAQLPAARHQPRGGTRTRIRARVLRGRWTTRSGHAAAVHLPRWGRLNWWPLAGEQAAYAARTGVDVRREPAPTALGERVGRVTIGESRERVLARLGRPSATRGGRARCSFERLRIRYRKGRVIEVTTRAAGHRTRSGLKVGTSVRRLRRTITRLDCGSAKRVRCVAGRNQRRGDRPTTFMIKDGVVSAIRVERLRHDVERPKPKPKPEPKPKPRPPYEIPSGP